MFPKMRSSGLGEDTGLTEKDYDNYKKRKAFHRLVAKAREVFGKNKDKKLLKETK